MEFKRKILTVEDIVKKWSNKPVFLMSDGDDCRLQTAGYIVGFDEEDYIVFVYFSAGEFCLNFQYIEPENICYISDENCEIDFFLEEAVLFVEKEIGDDSDIKFIPQ